MPTDDVKVQKNEISKEKDEISINYLNLRIEMVKDLGIVKSK